MPKIRYKIIYQFKILSINQKMDYDQDDTSDDEKKDYPNSHPNSMTSK